MVNFVSPSRNCALELWVLIDVGQAQAIFFFLPTHRFLLAFGKKKVSITIDSTYVIKSTCMLALIDSLLCSCEFQSHHL